jgi:hypothetical protein
MPCECLVLVLTLSSWEHTPEWQYTSKLLISKHQQVQLLEAASVLVAMNQDADAATKDSDRSSASPAASGSSDPRDDELSSTDTTPPPQLDPAMFNHNHRSSSSKRYSANSSAYSQSYQSAVFSDNGHGHYRHWSNVSDGRPTTSGTSVAGSYHDEENDQADLAAAVGLLSCSYSTPKTGPMALPADIPPVPPLPAQFLGAFNTPGSATITAPQSSLRASSYSYHQPESKDVDMDDSNFADEDDYRNHHSRSRSRGRMDDEDDGVFGKMEE